MRVRVYYKVYLLEGNLRKIKWNPIQYIYLKNKQSLQMCVFQE